MICCGRKGVKLLDKLERKFGRFAIKGLMKYVIIVCMAGLVIDMINSSFYGMWLSLDISKILHGQVWRLVTFVIQSPGSPIFAVLLCYFYFIIGTSLERLWGSFRINLFFFGGIVLTVIAAFLFYGATYLFFGYGMSCPASMEDIGTSMFLAYALLFPNERFLLMFIIPVKAKYLAIADIAYYVWEIIAAYVIGGPVYGTCRLINVLVAMGNVIIFFFMTKRSQLSPKNIKRRMDFKRSYNAGRTETVYDTVVDGKHRLARHKCAVCGRTELDDEHLEFRYCSKCNGDYEYCSDHLFTHKHVE